MKRIILLFTALMMGISVVYAQQKNMPQIEFEQTVYNYDTVTQGTSLVAISLGRLVRYRLTISII